MRGKAEFPVMKGFMEEFGIEDSSCESNFVTKEMSLAEEWKQRERKVPNRASRSGGIMETDISDLKPQTPVVPNRDVTMRSRVLDPIRRFEGRLGKKLNPTRIARWERGFNKAGKAVLVGGGLLGAAGLGAAAMKNKLENE